MCIRVFAWLGWWAWPTFYTSVAKARDRVAELRAATIAFAIDCKVAFRNAPKTLMEAATALISNIAVFCQECEQLCAGV